MRTLFDLTLTVQHAVQNRTKDLVDLCKFIIAWCEKESRSFLRRRIESKLADLYFRLQRYADALDVLKKLLSELKKKEDKILQVEAQLVESKVYHALENLPKSKAALTSVKTTANSIYVVPALQAEIDMMSGLIATDEKDYTTAYSYFYETFEGYRSMGDAAAGHSFKFMLFSDIFQLQPAAKHIFSLRQLLVHKFLNVIFIPDFAKYLLQQVLHGNDAGRAPEFIHHPGYTFSFL